MAEYIVLYIVNGLTVLIAPAVYLYLVVSVYPRLTLRLTWRAPRGTLPAGDRGVRKLTFPEGRAIVYEPAPELRRYMHRYALIKRDGCTYIQCRINGQIAYIRYEVATFDRRGRLLDVLSVSERITERGHTRAVRLPRATAYACVTLRQVDRMYTERRAKVTYSAIGIGIYAGISAVTAMIVGGILHSNLSEVLATLPLAGQVNGLGVTLTAAAVLGVISAGWVVYRHYANSTRC